MRAGSARARGVWRDEAHLRVPDDVEELDDVDAAAQVLEHLEFALDLCESPSQLHFEPAQTCGELAFFFLIGLRTCARIRPASARGEDSGCHSSKGEKRWAHLDDDEVVGADVDALEHLAVLAPADLARHLVVVLDACAQ